MTFSIPELAMKYGRAWADRDPDAIVAMHTDDSIFHMHDVAAATSGRLAIREVIVRLLAQWPDLRFDRKRVVFGAEHFVSEYVVSGTVGGKAFACDGVDVFSLRDGAVARKDSYIDWLAYLHQTGIDLGTSAVL